MALSAGQLGRDIVRRTRDYLRQRPSLYAARRFVNRLHDVPTYFGAWQCYRQINKALSDGRPERGTQCAVVLHLYYADRWEALQSHLERLRAVTAFHLVVTVPAHNEAFSAQIVEAFPGSDVFVVPNLGRDVLPFMQIAPTLAKLGFEYVLKLHSKKSAHFSGGDSWFFEMLDVLLPEDVSRLEDLLRLLQDPGTAVIGPGGQYMSLNTYLEENALLLEYALNKLGLGRRREVMEDPGAFGFFGGTVFWARLGPLQRLLRTRRSVWVFDVERGQVNGTNAHVLERLFTLFPVLRGDGVYKAGADGAGPLGTERASLPWWALET